MIMFNLFKKKKIKYLILDYLDISDNVDIKKQILTIHKNCVKLENKINEVIKTLNKDKHIVISANTIEK